MGESQLRRILDVLQADLNVARNLLVRGADKDIRETYILHQQKLM